MALSQHRKRRRADSGAALSHGDYTVGWICALPCELTAAESMLDIKHPMLPNPSGDKNVYCLGEISGHNVVITTLPSGTYGTASAAAVAIRMTTTFRHISIPLLVGIGGGVPKGDLRLGDVVVSVPGENNAIVQYDFGKRMPSGALRRTGHLRKPEEYLLAHVSLVRARHKAKPTKVPEIMASVLENDPLLKTEFSYPGSDQDQLYKYDCPHATESEECEQCKPSLVVRRPRSEAGPKLHYGSIASGNLVIKNSKTRDRLASELGVICFEMEAAGVMDYFPALVIRGICDYCDGSKNKLFQPYAAMAAAAFAKELLSSMPSDSRRTVAPTVFDSVIKQHTDSVVQDLNFAEAQSRFLTIKEAHPATLKWFLQHATYQSWLDDSKFAEHHGFLWIKGKPGAGKSTLMKYLLSRYDTSHDTISFFFNARGSDLQKTTIGMYRSFLSQLLLESEELSYSLGLLTYENQLNGLEVLRSLFKNAISHLSSPLTCFVDALDESSEDEVRELLEDLEMVAMSAKPGYFRVCCSSRYYPHISIEAGLEIRLDKEIDHDVDIRNYIEAKLRIGGSKEAKRVKEEVVRKAAGVFLWVVLVVQILAREFDRGRIHYLQNKLNQIPERLNDLIRDILLRDNENLPDLVASIQWVLHAYRPLYLEEFYYAVLMADKQYQPTAHEPEEVAVGDMERFILSSSKGLLELTRDAMPTVQVIHESVRELLMEDKLTEVWPGFKDIAPGPSHSRLAECCSRYIVGTGCTMRLTCNYYDGKLCKCMHDLDEIAAYHSEYTPVHVENLRKGALLSYPFLAYARSRVLLHAEEAESYDVQQQGILDAFSSIILTEKLDGRTKHSKYWSRRGLTQLLTDEGLPKLLKRHLSHASDAELATISREADLMRSITRGYTEVTKVLLGPAPGPSIDVTLYEQSIVALCDEGVLLYESPIERALSFAYILASCDKNHALLGCLLDSVGWLKVQVQPWIKQLVMGCAMHQLGFTSSPAIIHDVFLFAACQGDQFYVDKLLLFGADPEYKGKEGQTALHCAAEFNQVSIITRLSQVSSLETRDFAGLTPLAKAIRSDSHQAVIKFVQAGADLAAALPPDMDNTRRKQWSRWMQHILDGGTDLPPAALKRRIRDLHDLDA